MPPRKKFSQNVPRPTATSPSTAHTIQTLKFYVRGHEGWDRLNSAQQESLEMILHKIGRILEGNPNVEDHWDDIAGYAKLVSKMLEQASAMAKSIKLDNPSNRPDGITDRPPMNPPVFLLGEALAA